MVARDGLLERQLELVAQIRAAKNLVASAAAARAEDVAEHLAEHVAERVAGREPAGSALRTADTRVAEAVVSGALVRVG